MVTHSCLGVDGERVRALDQILHRNMQGCIGGRRVHVRRRMSCRLVSKVQGSMEVGRGHTFTAHFSNCGSVKVVSVEVAQRSGSKLRLL